MPETNPALLSTLKTNIKKLSESKEFKHHQWFFQYHLEIVEKIALELCDIYENADRDLVLIMVWMHDYGKMINFSNQYQETISGGKDFLVKLGFDGEISEKAVSYIEILDKKESLAESPIEIQIVSSTDGASHLIGPFFSLWWYENSSKQFKELMEDNKKKALKDWNNKIVIPEVKKSFENRYKFLIEQCGDFPEKFVI